MAPQTETKAGAGFKAFNSVFNLLTSVLRLVSSSSIDLISLFNSSINSIKEHWRKSCK